MDILFAIAAIAALAWGAVLLARGGLMAGCLLILLVGSCFGHPFFNVPLGPLPLTADRALLAVVCLQYLLLRRFGGAEPKPLAKADYVLAAFLGALIVNTFTHDWQAHKLQPASQLVFFYLMPTAMYWIARQARVSERGVRWMFAGFGVFGAYLAVTAFAETRSAWWLVFPKYIASPAFVEFFGRGRGPYLNPIGCGMVQVACLCAALMWWPRLGRRAQLALALVAPLLLVGIYCTLTRSVWMGAGAAVLIVVGLSLPRIWVAPLLAASLLVGVAGSAIYWDNLLAFKRDKNVSAADVEDSVKLRPILASVAWRMFLDRPLFGCGYGQYRQENRLYLSSRDSELPLEKARPYVQHNAFLALLTETGALGMSLWVSVLLLWVQAGWRLWRSERLPLWKRQCGLLLLAAIGDYVPNAMFHDVSLIAMSNMLLFFLAGLTMGLTPRSVLERRRKPRTQARAGEPELATAGA